MSIFETICKPSKKIKLKFHIHVLDDSGRLTLWIWNTMETNDGIHFLNINIKVDYFALSLPHFLIFARFLFFFFTRKTTKVCLSYAILWCDYIFSTFFYDFFFIILKFVLMLKLAVFPQFHFAIQRPIWIFDPNNSIV